MMIHGMNCEKTHGDVLLKISFTPLDVIHQLSNDGDRECYLAAGGEKPETAKICHVAHDRDSLH